MKRFLGLSILPALAALACTGLLAPVASAQSAPIAAPGAPPFTPAQLQQQQKIGLAAKAKADAIEANAALSPAEKQQKLEALSTSMRAQMMALLTPAQRAAVDKQNQTVVNLQKQFLAEHQAEIQKQNAAKIAFAKSLTPAQKKKIDAIQQSTNEQMTKLEQNKSDTPQIKESVAAAIMGNADTEGNAVLTPAQIKQLKAIRAMQNTLNQELTAYAKAHGQM